MRHKLLTITYISGLLQQNDLFVATLNDADAVELMEFFYNKSTCFMPPNHPRLGWCSQSKDDGCYSQNLSNFINPF